MRIHWFPGHMTKALRMLDAELSSVDCVVYVLDARAPMSSTSPAFDKIIERKPVLYVFNKADLTDRTELSKWKAYFEKCGKKVVIANSAQKTDKNEVIRAITELTSEVSEKFRKKGVTKTVRAMVVGVPNSGKSTLINSLVPQKKAVTGNRPGVTRGKQWVTIGDKLELLDSPGVTYPDFSDEKKAVRLAFLGSVKDDVVDVAELGAEFISFISSEYPEKLTERYGISDFDKTSAEIMEDIGDKRGIPKIRGEYDYERIGRLIITDFRKQYLGKIILEKTDEYRPS